LIAELSNMAAYVNENNAVVKKVLDAELNEMAQVEVAGKRPDKDFFQPEKEFF